MVKNYAGRYRATFWRGFGKLTPPWGPMFLAEMSTVISINALKCSINAVLYVLAIILCQLLHTRSIDFTVQVV